MLTLVPYGSDLYRRTLIFREAQLRRPLGLTQTGADLSGEEAQIHIALVEDGVVRGTVVLKPESDATMKLRQMAVDPHFQGKGIGRSLVAFAESVAREHGCRRIELHARTSARRFYECLGYQASGPEFLEVTVPHIAMSRDL